MADQDDLQAFLQKAQAITAQIQAAGAQLANQEVTGVCEGGAVQITMTSRGEVRAVRIDPRAVNLDNLRRLESQVADAIQNAFEQLNGRAHQSLRPLTEDISRLTADRPSS
jgi:DNA-binding protein YbaB